MLRDGVAQGDLLIPVIGSAVGVDGGGVESKRRQWVKHIKECSMKHVVSGRLLKCAKVRGCST